MVYGQTAHSRVVEKFGKDGPAEVCRARNTKPDCHVALTIPLRVSARDGRHMARLKLEELLERFIQRRTSATRMS